MHFEILIEDVSGKTALDILVPKIIGPEHTFRVIAYKGIGVIPVGLKPKTDAGKRILLDQLPRLLNGLGKTFANYPPDSPAAVIVVCDLDDKCQKKFRQELLGILKSCEYKPETRFCFAVEEGEAWLLGDLAAIKAAYPRAKHAFLSKYKNDSICGTWELLADALVVGGAKKLHENGFWETGREKTIWADKISRQMNIDKNSSPSFCYFRDKILQLIDK